MPLFVEDCEEGRRSPVGRLQPDVAIAPRSHHRARQLLASSLGKAVRGRRAVGGLGDPNGARDASVDLDPVDGRRLAFGDQLQRRPACIEDDDAGAIGLPGRGLYEPESVAVKGDRGIEILHREDEAQLADRSQLSPRTGAGKGLIPQARREVGIWDLGRPSHASARQQGPRATDSAFAYIDSKSRRRLPINDESHVRNALSRFNQTAFEDAAARDRARAKLLRAAKKYGIVPVGFKTGPLRTQSLWV
jgi:hypothetical protein